MKQLIINKKQDLQQELNSYELDELNENISNLEGELNELISIRNNILNKVKSLQEEIDFLENMIDKIEELEQGGLEEPSKEETVKEEN